MILEYGKTKEYAGIKFTIEKQDKNQDTWNILNTIKLEKDGQVKYIEYLQGWNINDGQVVLSSITMELARQYNFIKDLNDVSIQGIKNMLIDTFELDPIEAQGEGEKLFNSYCIVKELFTKDYTNMLLDVING